ncbi:GRAM domain-containing protein 2A-like isoform X2 [Cottoperca gobio]|uniref:GRAM domain-containing protein 2A-like isoform X2 n=1 Tax=Cottoperca gobio TaxID=56716 RepID=A0A6J2RIW5_COTGO|nr:GRAM domain-containing protein 2A-like isoform X2 [Cottoperca gobio]
MRKFSLDNSVCLDGFGVFGGRRGSSRFSSKKSNQCQTLYDAQQDTQELNHSINSNMSLREHTVAEENFNRSDGLNNKNSFMKHNKTFHKLFQEIPERETLTRTFPCALQKEVLYHGKLFVSENYVCFYSSVLLKDTKVTLGHIKVVIPASSIGGVKKHNSGLSMLSIQTADGEKYTFVSLRNRQLCYKLLHTLCSQAQGKSVNSGPYLSSAENEADPDVASSYSSLEDSIDHDLSRQNSICLDNRFPQMSSEAGRWIWRIAERVAPLFLLQEIRNLSLVFYVFVMLMMLLLLASGFIGLRIIALEEQLTELSFQYSDYQQT